MSTNDSSLATVGRLRRAEDRLDYRVDLLVARVEALEGSIAAAKVSRDPIEPDGPFFASQYTHGSWCVRSHDNNRHPITCYPLTEYQARVVARTLNQSLLDAED